MINVFLVFASVSLIFVISIIVGMNVVEIKRFGTKQKREIATVIVVILSIIISILLNMVIFGVI